MKKKGYILIGTLLIGICLVLVLKTIPMSVASQSNLHPDYLLLIKSSEGDERAVRELLRTGVDPNTPPGPLDKGMTALIFASWQGHKNIIRMLVNAGANVNAAADNGSTPLMYAAAAGDRELIRLLLAKGANPNAQGENGKIAIMFAVLNGHVEIINQLAEVTNSELLRNVRYRAGDNLLLAAVKGGNPAIVEAVLRTDPELEVRDRTGQTALMLAARKGYTRIVSKLINNGAEVNARDNQGVTPLTKAFIGNNIGTIQVLRANGAAS